MDLPRLGTAHNQLARSHSLHNTMKITPNGRTLVLSPSTAIASPRGWQVAGAATLPQNARYDEVHCIGGGSLLLWLLACAHRAPRGRVVYLHGPMVLPTPQSCAEWLQRDAPASVDLTDEYEWMRQAISIGAAGGLDPSAAWLKPLLKSVATGRSSELGARASDMQHRWERNGRIIHRPLVEEDAVLRELLHGARFRIDVASGGESAPTLLRCGETGCTVPEMT